MSGLVKEHGFGHEDWNFNFGFASNGQMRGYTVARPSRQMADEEFGIILATYDPLGWNAIGYYRGARFDEQLGRLPDIALQQMAVDIFELAEANQLAPQYRDKPLSDIQRVAETELIYHCWTIPIEQVFVFVRPRIIPATIFNPGVQRMKVPFNISESQFEGL